MSVLDIATFLLVIIGAINWGLVGWLNFDLVRTIFPPANPASYGYSAISRAVYAVVGFAALAQVYFRFVAAA